MGDTRNPKSKKNKENILLERSFLDKLDIWKPSVRTIFILFGLTIPLFFLTRSRYILAPLNEHLSLKFLEIHLGIAAILIPLALFTAQSMLAGKSEKSEVLLYESLFFPLVVFEILTLGLFVGSPNILIIIPVLIIAISTIISFKNIIKVLLYPEDLEEKEKDLLIKKAGSEFIKKLDQEINFRKTNNKLLNLGRKYRSLSINPFTLMSGELNIKTVISHKQGLVVNIKENEIKLLDDSITAQRRTPQINNKNNEIENKNQNDTITKPLSNLKVLLGDMVSSRDVLYEINQDYFKNLNLLEIEKRICSIIEIDENYDNDLASKSLRRLRDKCLSSIKQEEIGKLNKYLDIYLDILDSFYKYLSRTDGVFSEEQAAREKSNFIMGRLESLRWIHEDIVDIFEKGIDSSDRKIIMKTAYLPIRMMAKAIENRDHLIFQEFLIFPTILYKKALELKTKEGFTKNSELMLDRSWRYLDELSFFYLQSKRFNLSGENIENYGSHILKTFQSLLKIAIDNNDISSFNIYFKKTKELFASLKMDSQNNSREIENTGNKLNSRRNEMIYGVASWLVFLMKSNSDNNVFMLMYNLVKDELPQTLKDLSLLFNIVDNFNVQGFWGWDNWEMDLYPVNVVHEMESSKKLKVLFVVHCLQLLSSKTDDEIKNIQFEPSNRIAFMIEANEGSLIETANEIKNNLQDWSFMLDNSAIEKIDNFKEILIKAAENQIEKERENTRLRMISPQKVNDFKENFLKNYKDSFPISKLLKTYKFYSNKVKQSNDNIEAIGINTLFYKAAFFENNVRDNVYYTDEDNAFGFGRTISEGENEKIFKEFKNLSVKKSQDDIDNFFLDKDPKDYIILTTNNATWRFFEYGRQNYIPKWRQTISSEESHLNASGILKVNGDLIPVFTFFLSDVSREEIYILNKNKLGVFTHWRPRNENNYLVEMFDIRIQTLEEGSSEIKKLLEQPPNWLLEKGSREKQSKYLQEHLTIKIFEKFNYIASEDFDGIYIEVRRNNPGYKSKHKSQEIEK